MAKDGRILLLLCLVMVSLITALPVVKKKQPEEHKKEEATTMAPVDLEAALEYERYLKEVVEALESDVDFRKKLDHASEADVRNGKIALELDYVNHHVRTKLDEIKRRELDRLRSLANKAYELSNDIDRDYLKVPQHIDHGNEHTFEIEDLRKLIVKTSQDLAEADRKRRGEFKEYEMQKEFERESLKKEMDEEHRKKFEVEYQEKQEKHKKHEKIHHPGNKAQLEEVWEKQDHMDKTDFNPRVFFSIHDVDSNGFWDEAEVKALFVKELDKVYQADLPEDDMRERAEDLERMREHYFEETDSNLDGLISLQEFMSQAEKAEFQKDPEWETVDQQKQYTHEEYLEFERRRQEEVQRMIEQGLLPPHPNMPQGYYPPDAHAVYQQQHAANGYPQQNQQQQMHYQQPNQQHMQQKQQYQQQQNQYAAQQQQQQHYQGQPLPVQLNQDQVYQHVAPAPNQGQPLPQQNNPKGVPGGQQPQQAGPQQNVPAPQQAGPQQNIPAPQQPATQQHNQASVQSPMQQQINNQNQPTPAHHAPLPGQQHQQQQQQPQAANPQQNKL